MFEDGLDILQERARELRRFAQEKKSEQSRQHTEQLQSLEQYYKDQFSMLTESLAREKEEVVIRDKAQRTVGLYSHKLSLPPSCYFPSLPPSLPPAGPAIAS